MQAIAVPFHGAAVLSAVNLVAEGIFQPFEGLVVAIVAVSLLQLHGQAASPDGDGAGARRRAGLRPGKTKRAAPLGRPV